MIRINVDHQIAELSDESDKVVSGSINYLELSVCFTDDWNGYEKSVHFMKGDLHYWLALNDDSITKDRGIKLDDGIWLVAIEGISGTSKILTNSVRVAVLQNGVAESDASSFPEMSVPDIEDILNRLDKLEGSSSSDGDYINKELVDTIDKLTAGLDGKLPFVKLPDDVHENDLNTIRHTCLCECDYGTLNCCCDDGFGHENVLVLNGNDFVSQISLVNNGGALNIYHRDFYYDTWDDWVSVLPRRNSQQCRTNMVSSGDDENTWTLAADVDIDRNARDFIVGFVAPDISDSEVTDIKITDQDGNVIISTSNNTGDARSKSLRVSLTIYPKAADINVTKLRIHVRRTKLRTNVEYVYFVEKKSFY